MSVITLLFHLGWWALSLSLCFLTGIAAATMFMPEKQMEVSETQLRVAFDGDAVLFSDESERIFKAHGLDKFFEHERENENRLLDNVSIAIVTHLNDLYVKYDTEQMINACLKEQLSQKMKICLKMYSSSGHPRWRWVCFFIGTDYITCSPIDPLQLMGAVRMKVQILICAYFSHDSDETTFSLKNVLSCFCQK